MVQSAQMLAPMSEPVAATTEAAQPPQWKAPRWRIRALVLGAHLLVLLVLQTSLVHRRVTPVQSQQAQRLELRLIAENAPATNTPRRAVLHRPTSTPAARVPALQQTAPAPPPSQQAQATATDGNTPAAEASPPQAAASGPHERLIDTAATRAALRQSARDPTLKERFNAAADGPEYESAGRKLGKEMQRGAYGDCGKGQFAGGGMGLLSAPFYLLAEARGKCGRGITPEAKDLPKDVSLPPPPAAAHAGMER